MSNSTYPDDQGQPGGAIPVYLSGLTPKYIATATSTLVKTGPATLGSVIINTGGAGSSATIYDGVDNTGTVMAIVSTAAQGSIEYGLATKAGLFIVTSGGTPANITIGYR